MGVLGVLLAAAAGFAAGAVWYMILGRQWMAAVGRTEEEIKADRSPVPFVIGFLASLATAGMLRHETNNPTRAPMATSEAASAAFRQRVAVGWLPCGPGSPDRDSNASTSSSRASPMCWRRSTRRFARQRRSSLSSAGARPRGSTSHSGSRSITLASVPGAVSAW